MSGCNFLTGILLARYLGIEEFGSYVLAWIFVEFAAMLQHSLIISPMMSISPKQERDRIPSYLGSLMIQSGIFLVIVFVTLLAGVFVLNWIQPEQDLRDMALVLGCAACAYQFQDFLRRYFFARFRPVLALVSDVLRYGSQMAAIFVLVYIDSLNAVGALWVMAGSALLGGLVSLPFVEKLTYSLRDLKATTSRHWRFSKWITLSELMRWTSGDLFFVISGSLLGPGSVGALRASRHLVGVCHIFTLGLDNVIPVKAAHHFHVGGYTALTAYLRKMSAAGGGLILSVAVVASAAPEFWLNLIYGPQYQGYGYLVQLWSLVYLLAFLGRPLIAGLRAMEQTRLIFHAYFVSSVISVALAFPLIQWFGIAGMMWGIVGIQLLRLIVLLIGFKMRDSNGELAEEASHGKLQS